MRDGLQPALERRVFERVAGHEGAGVTPGYCSILLAQVMDSRLRGNEEVLESVIVRDQNSKNPLRPRQSLPNSGLPVHP